MRCRLALPKWFTYGLAGFESECPASPSARRVAGGGSRATAYSLQGRTGGSPASHCLHCDMRSLQGLPELEAEPEAPVLLLWVSLAHVLQHQSRIWRLSPGDQISEEHHAAPGLQLHSGSARVPRGSKSEAGTMSLSVRMPSSCVSRRPDA